MQTLTDVLRGQHRRIEALASAVTAAVLERDAARAQAQLELFRVAALEHLLQENLELYPRLLEAVGPRTPPGRILVRVEHEARHRERALATFEREWREVMQLLTSRLQSEEQRVG